MYLQAEYRDKTGQGFALVLVMFTLALLSVFAVSFANTIGLESRAMLANIDRSRARAAADGAAWWAVHSLQAQQMGSSSGELAGQGTLETAELSDAAKPNALFVDGTPHHRILGDVELVITIVAQRGLIDLNRAPEALLRSGFKVLGLGADEIAALVADVVGRRPVDEPGMGQASDRSFASVSELDALSTSQIIRWGRPEAVFTVHSELESIDASVAPGPVLAAIGELNGSAQNGSVRGVGPANNEPGSWLADMARLFSPTGEKVYRVRATATTPLGGTFIRDTLVGISVSIAKPYSIIAWGQGMGRLPPALQSRVAIH